MTWDLDENPYDPIAADLQRKVRAQVDAKLEAINALRAQGLPVPYDLEEFSKKYEQSGERS